MLAYSTYLVYPGYKVYENTYTIPLPNRSGDVVLACGVYENGPIENPILREVDVTSACFTDGCSNPPPVNSNDIDRCARHCVQGDKDCPDLSAASDPKDLHQLGQLYSQLLPPMLPAAVDLTPLTNMLAAPCRARVPGIIPAPTNGKNSDFVSLGEDCNGAYSLFPSLKIPATDKYYLKDTWVSIPNTIRGTYTRKVLEADLLFDATTQIPFRSTWEPIAGAPPSADVHEDVIGGIRVTKDIRGKPIFVLVGKAYACYDIFPSM